jgi:carotenoid cleavage dioxygenase-like enzyme
LNTFQKGLTNLNQEVIIDNLPIQGKIPEWLSGSLFRNGPAYFTGGHWFDGLAMVHKFSFKNGNVSYSNRFLRTDAYHRVMESGQQAGGFGSSGSAGGKNNTNVNIMKVDHHFWALTESPGVVEFDPITLNTVGVYSFEDDIPAHMTTAHPHLDIHTGQFINFTIQFGRTTLYHLYIMDPVTARRRLIGSIKTDRPGYMHSFAITNHYIILLEFPLIIQPIELMKGKGFTDSLTWKPEQGLRFLIVSKADGKLNRIVESQAGFGFHVINAFEQGDDIIIDACISDEASAVTNLYLDQLAGDSISGAHPKFKRYILKAGRSIAVEEILTSESIELPSIHYQLHNGQNYRYAYGVSTNLLHPENMDNQLIKMDTQTGNSTIWSKEDCYPGEPVFVSTPDSTNEDGGILLSVVLNGVQGRSFLLVLDAQSMDEIGRAEVPHHIPFGFHGLYTVEEC